MRTPTGKECRYFYGDYHRGRQVEECRLLQDSAPEQTWSSDLCRSCPVPGILMANACENMVLKAYIGRPFPFWSRKVVVRSYCTQSLRQDFDPHIGCGECHPLPPIFESKKR